GGAGNRDVRITRSVIAFPVWAFGTEDETGGSVRVELPAGYASSVQGDQMARSQLADGGTVLSAQPGDPFAFFAYISADRPGAFVGTRLSVAVGGQTAMLLIRAWEDDPDWGERTAELMTDGLPALQSLIGLDYPVVGQLSVSEAATSRLGEYAGIFNPTTNSIQVRYDADAFVALHEAAHIWFNGDLFRDRWINEAWAEYYAITAGEEIGVSGFTYELDDELLNARIPLNDWGGVGVESLEVEDFAYAASYELAGMIADRTDLDGLHAVWQAADTRQAPYQPLHATRPTIAVAATQPDWQRLLDLLEERTDASYADLWATWVVNDDELPLLEERASARQRYRDTVDDAGAWDLPESIRSKMGYWAFDLAVGEMDAAAEVLAQRSRIERGADALDLMPPTALQSAFEGRDGMETAAREAAQELEALDAIALTAAQLDDEPSPLEMVGLLGSDLAAGLAAARDSFESGDAEAAEAGARAATVARDAADNVGRERVVLGGAALLGINGLALAAASVRRRWRQVHQVEPSA
ncbi:MAG TPA: hypothetical protein VEW45_03710, partial [Candidatus Dormibacteraeota bacterium]|nr:hypothetical protein [Candidatus Dormibacteraeota bacterium]